MNDHSQNPTEPSKRPRGRPKLDDKRRKILDAALEAFAKRGYHGVSVPEVAESAGVGTGTVYRYFTDKQDLVNHVFRDAKARLGRAVLEGRDQPLDTELPLLAQSDGRALFLDLWGRLARFARREPLAMQFLELQDHTPYLDEESRTLERSLLGPLWVAGQQMAARGSLRPMRVEALMALCWGALVGLIKAERTGYLRLEEADLIAAGEACWAAIRTETPPKGKE